MKLSILASLFITTLFPTLALAQGHSNPTTGTAQVVCESADPEVEVDMDCIEEQLKTTGIGGWVHASVKDQLVMVFTWRRPGNFFVNVQLPMVSEDPNIMKQLVELRRHDQIEIKGEFFKNEAPINHINVTDLKIVKKYEGVDDVYEYDPQLPTTILNSSQLIGKVHIVANGGRVLVVEVGDRVYPVFNENPGLAQDLFRNDKIELNYQVQFLPMRPSHLMVDTESDEPIRVLERIEDGHGTEITLTGPLVMFPKSPQIKFNVFALRTEDADQVSRNFTIVNFEDIDLFFAIRDKLQATWDQYVASAQYDRNKYVNRKILLKVTGTKNVVSPTQANPQVVPASIDDIEIIIQ